MQEARALGPEQERPVGEKAGRLDRVDPGWILLREQLLRRAAEARQEEDVERRLGAVQEEKTHLPAVRGPGDLGRDVDVVWRRRERGRLPAAEVHDVDRRDRVLIARLRVALGKDLAVHGSEVHDGKRGHPVLVEAKVGDRGRVRRPFVGAAAPPARELLFVDPVEPAVEHVVAARRREAGLLARRELEREEIRLLHVRDARAVRRERGRLLLFGISCEAPRLDAIGEEPKVVVERDEENVALRTPFPAARRDLPLFSGAILHRHGRQELRLLPAFHVEFPEGGGRLGLHAFRHDPGNAVGVAPGEAACPGTAERRFGDLLERERLRRRGGRGGADGENCRRRQRNASHGHLRREYASGPSYGKSPPGFRPSRPQRGSERIGDRWSHSAQVESYPCPRSRGRRDSTRMCSR